MQLYWLFECLLKYNWPTSLPVQNYSSFHFSFLSWRVTSLLKMQKPWTSPPKLILQKSPSPTCKCAILFIFSLAESVLLRILCPLVLCSGPSRTSHRRCSVRKGVLRNFTKFPESTCVRVSTLINFIKIETLAQVFSCEFCEISKNIFFTEYVWATASVLHMCTAWSLQFLCSVVVCRT